MRAFNDKCDNVLYFLKDNGKASWEVLYIATGIKQHDAILSYLENKKDFIECGNTELSITKEGINFISKTSFVKQRDEVIPGN